MLSGVGAFAIENGLIAATSPVTRVRIRNVNTGTFIEADVQTPNGVVEYEVAPELTAYRVLPHRLRSLS